jgi:SAM-dependent methyltransferase
MSRQTKTVVYFIFFLLLSAGVLFCFRHSEGGRIILLALMLSLIAICIRLPWWWSAILGCFPLLVYGAWQLHWPPSFYLAAWLVLLLFFGSGSLRRAPLFLSGKSVWSMVADKLPVGVRVLDAGCGFAGLLHYLKQRRPDLKEIVGMELAWIPFALSWLRSLKTNVRIVHQNFWQAYWGDYDVVFVFLSPDPMPAVWEKFQAEMKPGSWLMSYQFDIPEAQPVWVEQDASGRTVYAWKR